MTSAKLKKWQKALQHCDTWVQSIEQTKELVQNKYGDVTELYNRSLEFDHLLRTGSFTDDLKPEAKRVDLMIWDFINESEKIGGEFLNSEIGLGFWSVYHISFLDFWKYSVHPILMPYYGEKINITDEDQMNIWCDSRVIKRRGKEEIIDSISWCRGKVTLKDIVRNIASPLWSDYEYLKNKAKPGRHSKAYEIDLESIVCSLLKDQGLRHKEISAILGYKDQQDGHGNIMNRTIGNRIKRGRELRQI